MGKTISIKDYSAALAKAKELDQMATDIEMIIADSKKMMTESTKVWVGSSSSKAMAKLAFDQIRMQKVKNEVKSSANKIRTAVKILQEADAKAAASINKGISAGISRIGSFFGGSSSGVSHR